MTETRKGLATSQIVLLVLGILVLAVVAYLLYSAYISGSQSVDANKCFAEKIRVCTICKFGSGLNPESCKPAGNKLNNFCGNEDPVKCTEVLPK